MAKSSKPTPPAHPAPKSSSKPAPKTAAKPAAKPAPKAKVPNPPVPTKKTPASSAAPAASKSGAKPSVKPAAGAGAKSSAKATAPAPASAGKSAVKPTAAKADTKGSAKSDAKGDAKGSSTKVEAKASAPAPAPAAAAAPGSSGGTGPGGAKVPPKGITIVSNKPVRKPKPKKLEMPVSEPLLKSGVKWKPLIASGPKAPPSTGIPGVAIQREFKADPKARMNKKELDHYRAILLKKRAELLGDIDNMEDGALRQNSSGSLSSMPQHMADQGSDTFEQSMSLSLVDVDRNFIREIDEALKRIMDGTYGVCLHTGRRIPTERLDQVPWTKYTIEAARELERKPIFVRDASYERAPSSKSENL